MLTWVEVNKQAIEYNLKQFKKMIGRNNLLMPVVKSNAYGHGIIEIAKICDHSKQANRICVVNLDEALTLINAGIKKPIMILSFYELNSKKIQTAVKNNIIFPVYLETQLSFLNKIALSVKKKVKIHIKIDTGTTRIGLLQNEAINFVKKAKAFKGLEVEGIWSHLASSEDNNEYTKQQLNTFNQTILELEKTDIHIPVKHLACSAASIFHKKAHFNAVRLGLSLYGLYPSAKANKVIKLEPALTWKTKIIQIKNVERGTMIGYGCAYKTKIASKIAILPIGYWDGLDRKLSNVGDVIVSGIKCPIRGRICMNLTMVDVSKVKNIKIGDCAIIIGEQGKAKITADDLAKQVGTINYEIVDRINPLLPRIIK